MGGGERYRSTQLCTVLQYYFRYFLLLLLQSSHSVPSFSPVLTLLQYMLFYPPPSWVYSICGGAVITRLLATNSAFPPVCFPITSLGSIFHTRYRRFGRLNLTRTKSSPKNPDGARSTILRNGMAPFSTQRKPRHCRHCAP